MTNIKVVDEQGQEIVQEQQEEVKSQGDVQVIPEGTLLVEQVAQLFDLSPNEISKHKPKLNTLIDYAKSKTDDHSPEGIKWALRVLSLKLGTPPMGEKIIAYMTRYAHLYKEKSKLDKELGKYHGDHNELI